MSIFWTPDEDDRPLDGAWPSRAVSDEIARWIDQRALYRAVAAGRALALRIATAALGLTGRRLPDRFLRPAIRPRRVS
jgi:hypothetical protein